jgi:hypothetical protein
MNNKSNPSPASQLTSTSALLALKSRRVLATTRSGAKILGQCTALETRELKVDSLTLTLIVAIELDGQVYDLDTIDSLESLED